MEAQKRSRFRVGRGGYGNILVGRSNLMRPERNSTESGGGGVCSTMKSRDDVNEVTKRGDRAST